MPKNTTNNVQFALVYSQDHLHVIAVDSGLTIDTGLETLEIYNNPGEMVTAILALNANRQSEATNKLNKVKQERGIE